MMRTAIKAAIRRRPLEAAFSYQPERKTAMLVGWKTIIFNVGVVVGTAILHWAAGFNWVDYVGPQLSVMIVAGANFLLRFVTNTPAMKSS